MASNKPVIHGRDHKKGGADPLDILFPTSNYSNQIINEPAGGLVLYWKLDELGNTTTDAVDSSGNGHTGAYGASTKHPTLGVSALADGTSAQFDGSNDTLAISTDVPGIQAFGAMSVEFWIKTSQTAHLDGSGSLLSGQSEAGIITSDSASTGGRFFRVDMDYATGQVIFIFFGTDATPHVLQGATAINDGARHYVVCTFDGTDQNIYIDGVLDATVAPSMGGFALANSNHGLWVGSGSFFDPSTVRQSHLQGILDEIALYTVALPLTSIETHFLIGGTASNPPSGTAGGDLTGNYPDPELADIGDGAETVGDSTHYPIVTVDDKGRVTHMVAQAVSSAAPSGAAGGALDGTYPNPGLAASVAGDGLAETSDVLSVNVDGTTIEINADTLRVKDGGITSAKILDGTIATTDLAFTPVESGDAAGGDLTGTYPNPTLVTTGPGATGPVGDATHVPVITIDANGRVTALTSAVVTGGGGGSTSLVRNARSSNTVLGTADAGTFIAATAAFTQTLTAAATLGAGWFCYLKNDTTDGTTVLTVDPNGSETIDGLTTIKMYSGELRLLLCDGSSFFSAVLEGGFARFTSSGTFVLPSGIENLRVECIGGGGQGGGGRGGAAGSVRQGGGGGGGAVRSHLQIAPAAAGSPGDSITVTVGAGGSAAGGGGSNASGSAGSSGDNTTFGSLLTGFGGGGGAGGSSANNAQGGAGGGEGEAGSTGVNAAGVVGSRGGGNHVAGVGGHGGVGAGSDATLGSGAGAERGGGGGAFSSANGAGTSFPGGTSTWGGAGGGGGGTIGTGNTERAGGAGGNVGVYVDGGGGGGAAGAVNGGAGTAGADGNLRVCGQGGGGGGAQDSGTGGNGGSGGAIGGGGGGGGGGTTTGGNGGNGGRGECRIWYS